MTNLERLEQSIEQKASLKDNLEELHVTFYKDTEEAGVKNNTTDTQLTVDSVSQLIDLGKDFSQLNNKMDLIDNIYEIDLNISALEKNIFDLYKDRAKQLRDKYKTIVLSYSCLLYTSPSPRD